MSPGRRYVRLAALLAVMVAPPPAASSLVQLAGLLVQHAGIHWTLALAEVIAVIGLAVAMSCRKLLEPAPTHRTSAAS